MNRGPIFIFGSLAFSRMIYAMCFYNMTAAFLPLAADFHYSLVALGLFSAAFYVGNATFQVPAGIFSAQRGPRFATILALTIITVSSFVSVLSGEFYFQIVTRFFTGLGAAFFFAPAMTIASGILSRAKSSLAVGLYNFPFNLGAGLALIIFTPLAVLDWRLIFGITGALTLIALIENFYALRGGFRQNSAIVYSEVRQALAMRDIWIALICVLGASSSFYVVSQFLVVYSENQLGFSPSLAGVISSIVLVGALLGSPLGGWLSDKFRTRRLFIMISVAGAALSIGLFSTHNVYITWVAAFLSGFFFSSANTGSLAYPSQLGRIGTQYIPIAIGLMNSVGTITGAAYTVIFPLLVNLSGYNLSWLLISLTSLVFAPLIYLAVEPYRGVLATSKK